MTDPILETRKISKRFKTVTALDRVDFSLLKGEIHALLGENGAGKSTLIKIITGHYERDGGDLFFAGTPVAGGHAISDHIAFVPQELSLFPHLTVAENVLISSLNRSVHGKVVLNHKELNRQAAKLLSALEVTVDPSTPVFRLGAAQRQMVQIARAMAGKFDILILDEPTSSISHLEIRNLFRVLEKLKLDGVSIIYITHKMDEVDELADRLTILRDGRRVGTHAVADIDHDSIVSQMAGRRLSSIELEKRADLADRKVVLDVAGLSGPGFKDIHLKVRQGEIVGLAGLVGAGRTEIAMAVSGSIAKRSGTVQVDGTTVRIRNPHQAVAAGLVYIPEERKERGIFPALSLRENITLPVLKGLSIAKLISVPRERDFVRKMIDRFRIKVGTMDQKIGFLSGGNQQKAIIARAISVNPKVILFDEPTRGIDVNAKAEIYLELKRLSDQGMGIVVISSEIEELFKVSDRIVVVHNGRIRGEFAGADITREAILRAALGLV